ncbi:MAG: hypothetical protein JWO63_2731 [Frankiales bacterium]|nr:hypothetical protein [Frankiales bacterium]
MELRPRFTAPARVRAAGGAVRPVTVPAADGPRRPLRVLLSSRWIGLHLLVWVGAVVMVLLGRWQLNVSDDKHFDLQNFGYALQWWTFTAFALFFWLRAMRDARRPIGQTSGGSRLFVRPRPAPDGTVAVLGQNPAAYVGLADLVTVPDAPGAAPLRYHGYLMPNSASQPARSGGDSYHASYNDYLWQLGQAASDQDRLGAAGQPTVDPTARRLPSIEDEPAG